MRPPLGTGVSGTGRFTQPDPIGLSGGLNLYGYAGGDPVNSSDPFGLCPKRKREDCEGGGTVAVAVSGSAAISNIGVNFEAGIVYEPASGRFSLFAGAGNALGVGASLGVEVTAQRGSIADFLGGNDMNDNSSELEVGAGLVGANIVVAPGLSGVAGAGVNAGVGGGVTLNLRAATAATPPASLMERIAALPPIRLAPHH